jgi:hypothetical protein
MSEVTLDKRVTITLKLSGDEAEELTNDLFRLNRDGDLPDLLLPLLQELES